MSKFRRLNITKQCGKKMHNYPAHKNEMIKTFKIVISIAAAVCLFTVFAAECSGRNMEQTSSLDKVHKKTNLKFQLPPSPKVVKEINQILIQQKNQSKSVPLVKKNNFNLLNPSIFEGASSNHKDHSIQIFPVGKGPIGTAIDANGDVWVADTGSSTVTELSSSGAAIGTFPVGNGPNSIAIDANGDVWVANIGSNTVTELNSSGAAIGTFPVGKEPSGIAIDANGNVWVANNNSSTVTELNSSGAVIGTFPVGKEPSGIAIDILGDVWVANDGSSTVTELNSSGAVIGTFPVGIHPFDIAIDYLNNIWITNDVSNTVTELNNLGNTINTFDTIGKLTPFQKKLLKLPSASAPTDIAIDNMGNVWVDFFKGKSIEKMSALTRGPQFFPYKGPEWP